MKRLEKYKDGMKMDGLTRLAEVSHYNHNYYVGLDKDLLFALSDDDNTTEWWVVYGINNYYLGESYCSEGDVLNRYDCRCT